MTTYDKQRHSVGPGSINLTGTTNTFNGNSTQDVSSHDDSTKHKSPVLGKNNKFINHK